MSTFFIKQGDTEPSLRYQLTGAGGVVQALGPPTAGVVFRMKDKHPLWYLPPVMVSFDSGGTLTPGLYHLAYTYVVQGGESPLSVVSSDISVSSGAQIHVPSIAPLPSWATAVRWYFVDGPSTGFIVQNNGTTFDINSAGNGTKPPTPVQELLLISADATGGHVVIESESTGTVRYDWQSGDTDTAGTYYGDFVVTLSGEGPESFPNTEDIVIVIGAK